MKFFANLKFQILVSLSAVLIFSVPLRASQHMVTQLGADEQIQNQLQEKFAAQGDRLTFVKSSVGRNTLTLTGTVHLYRDKLLAEEIARQSEPQHAVFNRIEVLGDIVNDQELRQRVAEHLKYGAADLGISFPQVVPETHNGNVLLRGDVRSFPQRSVVLELAAETPGVTSIRDELVVLSSALDREALLNAAKNIYSKPEMAGYLKMGWLPVRVYVRDGQATLLGSVRDEQQRKAVASDAFAAYGVVSVENQVGIQPSPSPAVSSGLRFQPHASTKPPDPFDFLRNLEFRLPDLTAKPSPVPLLPAQVANDSVTMESLPRDVGPGSNN